MHKEQNRFILVLIWIRETRSLVACSRLYFSPCFGVSKHTASEIRVVVSWRWVWQQLWPTVLYSPPTSRHSHFYRLQTCAGTHKSLWKIKNSFLKGVTRLLLPVVLLQTWLFTRLPIPVKENSSGLGVVFSPAVTLMGVTLLVILILHRWWHPSRFGSKLCWIS